jgi:hypothetical protein
MALPFRQTFCLSASLKPTDCRTQGPHLTLKAIGEQAALAHEPSFLSPGWSPNPGGCSGNPVVGAHSPSPPGLSPCTPPQIWCPSARSAIHSPVDVQVLELRGPSAGGRHSLSLQATLAKAGYGLNQLWIRDLPFGQQRFRSAAPMRVGRCALRRVTFLAPSTTPHRAWLCRVSCTLPGEGRLPRPVALRRAPARTCHLSTGVLL